MKFSIGKSNLRVFVRAIHSLAKIGEEIYFEWIDEGLTIRSVNSSRSAYACFTFYSDFFNKSENTKPSSDDRPLRWKISVKSCLTVFRANSSMEKKVERCKISFDHQDARLNVQFVCRQGIMKTHRLTVIDCESLQAVFKLKDSMSCIVISSKVLSEAVQNFQPGQEEITMCAGEDGVELKNHVEDEAERGKTINTSLTLLPDEFEDYRIVKAVAITFCVRELKALLTFGEQLNLPLKLYFEGSGKPLIFTYDEERDVASHFVLATLATCPTLSQAATSQSNTQTTARPRATQQTTSCQDHEETTFDIDAETLMTMEEDDFDKAGDNEGWVFTRPETFEKKRPYETWAAPTEDRNEMDDINEPSSKKRCMSLFASIMEDDNAESTSFCSQRTAGEQTVLVADSDPED